MAYRFLRTARPLSNLRPSAISSTTRRAATSFASSPAPRGCPPRSKPIKTAAATPTIEEEGTVQPNVPLRKGAPPEFEGETNPKTGEVGGPKNEPLRWGAAGDYSFNGRVTDF
ncbi:hypothetical protein PG997_002426 [Apiospora hydei]|uniref:Succinate dehydrogenase assembly factor 4, mitochondrial n=1 Tax=Apiospora hydei TaxID=1337664 RepID=A0ABR1X9C5_9PEZI